MARRPRSPAAFVAGILTIFILGIIWTVVLHNLQTQKGIPAAPSSSAADPPLSLPSDPPSPPPACCLMSLPQAPHSLFLLRPHRSRALAVSWSGTACRSLRSCAKTSRPDAVAAENVSRTMWAITLSMPGEAPDTSVPGQREHQADQGCLPIRCETTLPEGTAGRRTHPALSRRSREGTV